MRRLVLALALAVGCTSSAPSDTRSDDDGGGSSRTTPPGSNDPPAPDPSARPDASSQPSGGIASKYPGDVGIDADPEVVFYDGFEDGSIEAVVARYDDAKKGGLSLVADAPPKSPGSTSVRMYADPSAPAADLFKELAPGYEELWVRYYAKYQGGAHFHHTGVWLGGFNPSTKYPNPKAGIRPNGDDRFHISLEPMSANGSPNPRLDFYAYWMKMRSWMDNPSGDGAYYGNALVHKKDLVVRDDEWMCIELHVKLNTDTSNATGAELGLYIDGSQVVHFDEKAPLGCWIRDKFCPEGADTSGCTDYPDLCTKPLVPLDLQLRSTTDLKLTAFWPQNYITKGTGGSFQIDDVVIATSYVGCIH